MTGPSPIAISQPAAAITENVVAIVDANGLGAAVSAADPLPVASLVTAAGSTALAGTASASATLGPFLPVLGRAIWVQLDGSWTGSVQVRRSVDSGATTQPLTVGGQAWATYSANANEPIGEESVAGASYYLAVTLTGGTISYRVQQ